MPVVSGYTPSPSARTFGELKAELARYIKMPTDPEALAVAGDCVLDAIRFYNTKTWKWGLVYLDITLVADNAEYDLLGDTKEPRYAELLDSANRAASRLRYQDPRSFLEANFPITSSGEASAYTLMNVHETGTLRLDTPPSAAFITTYPTLRFWYYRRIQHPAADGDVIDVPSEVEGGIVAKGKSLLCQIYDKARVGIAENEHAQRWQLIHRDNVMETRDWE